MSHKPFNKHFWFALSVIIFAGGLLYGQAVGLNDALDQGAATISAATVFTPERIEIRHIDSELRALTQEPLDDGFDEVDSALDEL
jgi:hypothetical protein